MVAVNWVDLVIILVLIYFVLEAFKIGFWVTLADFGSFLLSLLLSLRFYGPLAEVFRTKLSVPYSFSKALGFLSAASFSELFLGYLFVLGAKRIPHSLWKSRVVNYLAFFPAVGEGIIILSFLLTLLLGLPISDDVKNSVTQSRIGGYLIKNTTFLERKTKEVFGGLIEDSLTYFTVKPGSLEVIPLKLGEVKLSIDLDSEQKMLDLVNLERKKAGIGELIADDNLRLIARDYARNMWERGYFGHYSPEGEDVGDRLEEKDIPYTIAGENLALAPTVGTAHTGLMSSEGHRKNILNSDFRRLGVGVIDNGIYGKMFVQVFTD
jgi:uncharacterized membrane protein required for colicin V production